MLYFVTFIRFETQNIAVKGKSKINVIKVNFAKPSRSCGYRLWHQKGDVTSAHLL
jgi:hypothetical protein